MRRRSKLWNMPATWTRRTGSPHISLAKSNGRQGRTKRLSKLSSPFSRLARKSLVSFNRLDRPIWILDVSNSPPGSRRGQRRRSCQRFASR